MNRIAKLFSGLLGAGALLVASNASADTPRTWYTKTFAGKGGKPIQINAEGQVQPDKNSGPGTEQAIATHLVKNGKTYVVSIAMSSDVTQADRPWQCKCTSIEVGAAGEPTVLAREVQLTRRGSNNNSDRPCNHPVADVDAQGNVIWVYGSDANNTNVQEYVGILNERCETVAAPTRVSDNNNNNQGAPDAVVVGGRVYTGYNDNGDRTKTVVANIIQSADGPSIQRVALRTTVNESNVARPEYVDVGEGKVFHCSSAGNQRPPEQGNRCGVIQYKQGATGNLAILSGEGGQQGNANQLKLVQASEPNGTPRFYMNMPIIASMGGGLVSVMSEKTYGNNRAGGRQGEQRGQGRQRGTTEVKVYSYQVNTATGQFTQQGAVKNLVGVGGVHEFFCAGEYGATPGQINLAHVSGAITGSGPALLTPIFRDNLTGDYTLLSRDSKAVTAEGSDSGLLANLLGQDPTNSGRDFMQCAGTVKNPGRAINGVAAPGAFQPAVDTFWVVPSQGRIEGSLTEKKNAGFLSLIPARLNGYTAAPVATATTSSSSSSSSGASSSSSSSSSSSAGGPVAGTGQEGGPCFPNATCMGSNVCVDALCGPPASGAASNAAAAASSAAAAANNNVAAASSSAAANNNAAAAAANNNAAASGGTTGGGNVGGDNGGGGDSGEGEGGGCSDSSVPSTGSPLFMMVLGLAGLAMVRRNKRS